MLTQTMILLQVAMHLLRVQLSKGNVNLNESKQPRRILRGFEDIHHRMPFAVILESLKPFLRKKPDGSFHQKFRICTGSLISATWVVTAGHCIKNNVKRIRYGDVNAANNASNTFSKVLRKIAHPTYRNVDVPENIFTNNDIGLVQVERVPLVTFVRLSGVDYMNMLGHSVFIAGFGKSGRSPDEDSVMPLQVAEVAVRKCPNHFGGPYICHTHKCFRFQETAPGDSGGPMLYEGMLAGVCTGKIKSKNVVGVFTAVSPFIHWIRSTVKRFSEN